MLKSKIVGYFDNLHQSRTWHITLTDRDACDMSPGAFWKFNRGIQMIHEAFAEPFLEGRADAETDRRRGG